MKVLIVVDPQNDFVKPNGNLAIPNAELAIPNINKLLTSNKFDYKIITQDWHPENHVSFAKTHGAELFTQKETLQGAGSKAGIKTINQVMWPNHCIAGTTGAEIHENILEKEANAIFRKGHISDRECYSVFEFVYPFDNQEVFGDEYITPHFYTMDGLKADEIYICGYAGDFCCQATAISATRLTDKIFFIKDAMGWVDNNNEANTYTKLLQTGKINIIKTEEAL